MKEGFPTVSPLFRRLRALAPGFRRVVQSAPIIAFAAAALCALAPDAFAQEPKIDLETRFQKCLDAGWGVARGNKLCQIRVRHGDNHIGFNNCRLEFPYWHRGCHQVFGPYYDFPQKTEANKGISAIFDCHKISNGLLPSTHNIRAANQCTCAQGSIGSGKSCVCPAGMSVWNGKCAVCPVGAKPSGNGCACLIPGQEIIGGVCTCPPDQVVVNGACACPPASNGAVQGMLQPPSIPYGVCGVCPSGEGVLNNGACGVCPGGASFLVNGICASPDNSYEQPAPIALGKPVVREMLAYDTANFPGNAMILRWGAPLHSDGGEILEYRVRRQRSVSGAVSKTGSDSWPARCDTLAANQWNRSTSYKHFGRDVFEHTYDTIDAHLSGLANYSCYRFYVSARNAAGWGPEAVTDPVMVRPARGGSAVSCRADQARAWNTGVDYAANHGCLSRDVVQGVDWCHRVSGGYITQFRPRYGRSDQNRDGHICHREDENVTCGPYRREQIVDYQLLGVVWDKDVLCHIGEGPHCPSGEFYDFAHRACMCNGMGARPAPGGVCVCSVEGADNNCNCPSGTVYHPDINKCAYGKWGEEFALTSPLSGAVEPDEVGEVRLRVYRTATGEPFPEGGVFNVYLGDSKTPLADSCRNAALEFKTVTLANPARRVAGVEGTCSPNLPVGRHNLRAEYQLRADLMLVGGGRRNCDATCQARTRLRAFALPAVAVRVEQERQKNCENPNPAINPAGGEWRSETMQCLLPTEAFFHKTGDFVCGHNDEAGLPECDDVFAEMRKVDCLAEGLVYQQEGGAGKTPDYSCVCPHLGEARGVNGNVCSSESDTKLVNEVQKRQPNTVTILALLEEGASPNLSSSEGVPILVIALTMKHAKVVSILITAGANASVQINGNFLPDYLTQNGLRDGNTIPEFGEWRDVLNLMAHFGGAVRVVDLTSRASSTAYDWSATSAETGHHALAHLRARYDGYVWTPRRKEEIKAIGGYILDQGAECPDSYANHVICASRRACNSARSGLTYSCTECPGFPLRSANGRVCVAECATSSRGADTTTWPDSQCTCADGTDRDELGCVSEHDDPLIAEVKKIDAKLATVRYLLDQGARAGVTTSAGVPLLIVAATLRHAEIVSVLITAGADPNAEHTDGTGQARTVPAYAVISVAGYSAREDAELLIHFGGGVSVNSNVEFDYWGTRELQTLYYYPLAARYGPEGDAPEKDALEVMAAYLVDQSKDATNCEFNAVGTKEQALCIKSRRKCGTTTYYSCELCENGNNIRGVHNNICVAACGANEVFNADAWPEPACKCASGTPNAQGQCPGDLDDDLFAAVNTAAPTLSVVVDFLSRGANPNFINSDGIHVLVAAATLLHAEVVSVLITAGANSRLETAVAGRGSAVRVFPEIIVHEFGRSNNSTLAIRTAEALRHFGDAAALVSPAAAYPWDAQFNYVPIHKNLYTLLAARVTMALDEETRAAAKFMAEYLNDRGVSCARHLGRGHPLCVPSRICPTTGDSVYSCSECAEHSLRARTAAACVAECGGANEEANTTAWPDGQCQCAKGAADELGCRSPYDGELIEEVEEKSRPNLDTVRRLLGLGARPDVANSAGVPLVFVAATLGHAEVVSVLVTAGANARARITLGYAEVGDNVLITVDIGDLLPEYLAKNGLSGDPATATITLPWRDVADVMIHFGAAVDIVALTSGGVAYNWATAQGTLHALEHLRRSYDNHNPTSADKAVMEVIGGYMLDQGAACPDDIVAHAVCASRRACAAPGSGMAYSCSACAGFPLRSQDGASCVAECGRSEETGDAAWPDRQCQCMDGVEPDEFGCPSSHDDSLIEEITKAKPDLAAVRDWLNKGARPGVTTSAGIPPLVVAATLLHAEIVSVLITAGADVSVKFWIENDENPNRFPQLLPVLLAQLAASSEHTLSANREFAETFFHFGDAAGDKFNWQDVPQELSNVNVGNAILYYVEKRHADNLASADSAPANLAQNPFLERVGWYVRDRGGVCSNVANKDSPICAARPACPATSAGIYACSECPGFPLYSESRGGCVAQCGGREEIDATTWPDRQCKCLNGEPDEFGCPSTHDEALVAAVQESPPSLARVRELLDLGARSDVTTSAGTPILVVAATMGRAEIVSVLITAGANASVSVGMNYIPEHMAENGVTDTTTTTTLLPWRDAANVMIHFGGAVNVAALTSGVVGYDWSKTGRYDILTHLNFVYESAVAHIPTEEEKRVIEVMSGYALDQGAECPRLLRDEPICASRRICPAADSGKAYSCSAACPGLPVLSFNGLACVAQCRGNEELDATTWPDEQCVCPEGATRDEFGCRSSHDAALIAEVQKTPQSLVSVRALLDQGARPGITTSAGIPILIVAATLRHADVVSVLITAGADPNAEHQSARVPTHAALGAAGHSARDDAELLIHFGDAAAIAAITSTFAFSWQGPDIASLVARYEDAATTDEEKYALEVMGAYLVDQGADCAAHAGNSAAALCQSSRRGCIPSKFPQYYSCGLCQNGNNVLGVTDNNICVAACGANEVLAATWPDPVCKCASGDPNAQGQCPGELDDDLFAAVNAANPVLSSVVALLNDGANPNFINSDGIHVLVAAATLLRADVISVLVTAGATPQARAPDTALIPDLILEGLSDVSNADQARRMAEAMRHFGDAVAQATLTSSAFASAYFWSSEAEFNQNLYAKLQRAHDNAANGEIRTVIKFMAEYLRDQGALCELFLAPNSALCAYSRACPATGGGVSSCSYCSGRPLRSMDGASCVSECGGGNQEADATAWPDKQCRCAGGTEQVGGSCVLNAVAVKARLCRQAGWPVSSDGGGACGTPVTLFGGADASQCSLTGFDSPQCAAVFGAGADRFPAPVTSPAGATLSFVYGCDPDESKKLVPAIVNTIGATECACPPLHLDEDGVCTACPTGQIVEDGACVACPVGQGVFPDGTCGNCPAGSVVEGGVCAPTTELLCASKSWNYAGSDDSCGIKVTLAGGAASVKCYLSGSNFPQCADVFGSNADIPFYDGVQSEGVDDALVYNCDPEGATGMLPATANRILATECACPIGQTVKDGVCACPNAGDVVRDGTCVPKTGPLDALSHDLLCRVFGGTALIVTGGKICHGMDKNDTFCIMDSDEGFPCQGLFTHLQKCNLQFERPALNPFFCGAPCVPPQKAVGARCK